MPRANYALLFLCLCCIIFFSSCTASDGFSKEFAKLEDMSLDSNYQAELIKLDQRYPDRFALKLQLGMYSIYINDYSTAKQYLKRAEALYGQAKSDPERSKLYGGLAYIAYKEEDYPLAEKLARKAISFPEGNAKVWGFLVGRSLLGQNQVSAALTEFDKAWKNGNATMQREDYRAYIRTLAQSKRWRDLIEVINAFEKEYGYEAGSAELASTAFKNLDDYTMSVFCAFKELEYLMAYGTYDRKLAKTLFEQRKDALVNSSIKSGNNGAIAYETVLAYLNEDWPKVVKLFDSVKLESPEPYLIFLMEYAKAKAGKLATEDLAQLEAIAPSMRAHPNYFQLVYYLSRTDSSISELQLLQLLDASINIAPKSRFADLGRREMAILLGLSDSTYQLMLTRLEIETCAQKAHASSEGAYLDPIVKLLGLQDNERTFLAIEVLKVFAGDSRFEQYFEENYRLAAARTKERLAYLMGS